MCRSAAFVQPPYEHVLRVEEGCCFFSHGFFPGTTVRGSCWRSRAGLLRAGASLLLAAASAHAAVFGTAFALRARARGCRMQAARHEPVGGDVSSACATRYLYSASFCGDGGRRVLAGRGIQHRDGRAGGHYLAAVRDTRGGGAAGPGALWPDGHAPGRRDHHHVGLLPPVRDLGGHHLSAQRSAL